MANAALRGPVRGLSDAHVASQRSKKATRSRRTVARAESKRGDGKSERVLNAILAPLTALALVSGDAHWAR